MCYLIKHIILKPIHYLLWYKFKIINAVITFDKMSVIIIQYWKYMIIILGERYLCTYLTINISLRF